MQLRRGHESESLTSYPMPPETSRVSRDAQCLLTQSAPLFVWTKSADQDAEAQPSTTHGQRSILMILLRELNGRGGKTEPYTRRDRAPRSGGAPTGPCRRDGVMRYAE